MMNLDQLRIFQAVAQSRSFTRAAALVHLTQPGISKHIKQMEQYFGVPLFDRTGKKVMLTAPDEILFAATQEIMAVIDAAERRIDDLKGLRGGKLRLGASFPVGVYILPAVLATFRKRNPAVDVTLEISLSETIETITLANELDLGLVSHQPRDSKLFSKAFMTDELIVILPRNHKWAAKKRIKPEDLATETFVVAARGAGTRTVVEERLKAMGIVLGDVLEFGNLEGVKHAVEAGLGISIQARSVVRREISAGSLRALPLSRMDPRIQYLYIYRKHRHLSRAVTEFLALLAS
ncbi:MAG TPA: LysR family transcriptional regulator [Terriglobales bacterium]